MTTESHPNRREFMRRITGSALAAIGAGVLGLAFWDRKGPQVNIPKARDLIVPDFSVPAQTGMISVAHGSDRIRNVALAVNALGGMQAFVKPGDKVLLKVNAAFATPPSLGATTHPQLVAKAVELCLQAGAGQVRVTDNPINDPTSCFELSGIGPAARKAGAELILPAADRFTPYSLPGGRLLRHWPVFSSPLLWADRVIGLGPVKDHHRSGASLTIKNWYGLLGGRRNIFHQQIHAIIAELAMMIKPSLVILDGTNSMMSNGPTGGSLDDLKATHTLIAGTDPVAVDTLGAELLGKRPSDLPYLALAEKAGAGTVDYRSLRFSQIVDSSNR
jgi:uncharacterized protein (DUF362 family)